LSITRQFAALGISEHNRRQIGSGWDEQSPRTVIALGAGGLVAPLRFFAQQQGKVWRVGFLSQRHVDFLDSDVYYGPFRSGMRELGYVEGKNLVIEWRSAEGKSERLPDLALELVKLKVDVIVTAGTPPTLARISTRGRRAQNGQERTFAIPAWSLRKNERRIGI
jgi:hypothetical protein